MWCFRGEPRPGIRNNKLMQCSCRAALVFVEAVLMSDLNMLAVTGVAIKKGACDLDGTCDSGGWRLDR
jgi:hypothetical protein